MTHPGCVTCEDDDGPCPVHWEADEIVRLRAENARMREAIKKAVSSGRAHHEEEPKEAPDLWFFLCLLRDLESALSEGSTDG